MFSNNDEIKFTYVNNISMFLYVILRKVYRMLFDFTIVKLNTNS